MTIRDELAARFTRLYACMPALHLSYSFDERVDSQRDLMLALADECIRQMEWAMRLGTATAGPGFGPPPMPDLSAAPDDWSVPKEVQP